MKHRQTGAALFVALMLLMILSVLGGVMLSTSGQGAKVTVAMGERIQSEQRVEGQFNQLVAHGDLQSSIGSMASGDSMAVSGFVADALGDLTHSVDGTCSRSYTASSGNAISNCRYVRSQITESYGKNASGSTSLAGGIEQPLL